MLTSFPRRVGDILIYSCLFHVMQSPVVRETVYFAHVSSYPVSLRNIYSFLYVSSFFPIFFLFLGRSTRNLEGIYFHTLRFLFNFRDLFQRVTRQMSLNIILNPAIKLYGHQNDFYYRTDLGRGGEDICICSRMSAFPDSTKLDYVNTLPPSSRRKPQ